MTKDPIEIGRTRRPMECALTEAERKQRSDQVHAELELRTKEMARRDLARGLEGPDGCICKRISTGYLIG